MQTAKTIYHKFIPNGESNFKLWLFWSIVLLTVLDIASTAFDIYVLNWHEVNPIALAFGTLTALFIVKLVLIPVFFVIILLCGKFGEGKLWDHVDKAGDWMSVAAIVFFAAIVTHNFFLLGLGLGRSF